MAEVTPWLHRPRARTFTTKCDRGSQLKCNMGTKRLWEGPHAPSSTGKIRTTELPRDAGSQDGPGELLHRAGSSAAWVSSCPGPLVAVETHGGEAMAGREMQVGSGRGDVDFGAVVKCR